MKHPFLAVMVLCPLVATAQLVVTVTPPKVVGQKAIVQLKLKNNLASKVESARAVCFLLDDQGNMAGQSTKWVIGQNHTGLEPKAEAMFNFVITSPQPWTTTNLTTKVAFTRLILAGGQAADPNKNTIIKQSQKN